MGYLGSLFSTISQPCFVFAGDGFENDPGLRQVRFLLLDFFRGRQVDGVNLGGLDRVIFVTHPPGRTDSVMLRQYCNRFKKSGTRVPRVDLEDAGPAIDLAIRRRKDPTMDLEKEATRQPKTSQGKKIKNMGTDAVDGKIGRIYMPKQQVDGIALRKMKGLKRERRAAAAGAAGAKRRRGESDGGEEEGSK
jgi:ribosome production factor 2